MQMKFWLFKANNAWTIKSSTSQSYQHRKNLGITFACIAKIYRNLWCICWMKENPPAPNHGIVKVK